MTAMEPMSPDLLIEALRASNQARLDKVAAAGFPLNVLGCYAADLVDYLMPEGTTERIEFDGRWENHLSVLLDEAETMIRRATLTGQTDDTMAANLVRRAGGRRG